MSRETKELLTEVLLRLERELGRRLSYDEVNRILVRRAVRATRACCSSWLR